MEEEGQITETPTKRGSWVPVYRSSEGDLVLQGELPEDQRETASPAGEAWQEKSIIGKPKGLFPQTFRPIEPEATGQETTPETPSDSE